MLFLSCEKNGEDETLRLPLKYKLVNNGDRELYKMNIYAELYFPVENITLIYNLTKSKKFEYYHPNKLDPYDSIIIEPEILGYENCNVYLSYYFYFIDTNDDYTVFKYNYYDTISNIKQGSVTFTWPNDTASFMFNPF